MSECECDPEVGFFCVHCCMENEYIKRLESKLAIATEACNLYEQAFDDTGNDYEHLVCLQEARKALEKLNE